VLSASMTSAERGSYVAFVLAASMSGFVGGLALDTSIPAQRARLSARSGTLVAVGCVAWAAVAAAIICTVTGVHQIREVAVGAGVLAATSAFVGQAISRSRHEAGVVSRLAAAVPLLLMSTFLAVSGARASIWKGAWLVSQIVGLMVFVGWSLVPAFRARSDRIPDTQVASLRVGVIGRTFLGVTMTLLLYRADQLLLVREGDLAALGVYALVASMVEAAASPATYLAQRVLAEDVPTWEFASRLSRFAAALAATVYCVAVGGVWVVLQVLNVRGYGRFLGLSALMLPGVVAMAFSRPIAALCLASGMDRALIKAIAGVTVLALGLYLLAVQVSGSFGLAFASSIVYISLAGAQVAVFSRGARANSLSSRFVQP
jgi:hypothetical protein